MEMEKDLFGYDLIPLDPDEQQAWWDGLTPDGRQAWVYEVEHGRPPTWLGRLAFGLQQAQEMADIVLADTFDDVDCSLSTMHDRDDRYGHIEDTSPWWVGLVAKVIVTYATNRARFYCSGAPYTEARNPLLRALGRAVIQIVRHRRYSAEPHAENVPF